jgi:hypothetical protein
MDALHLNWIKADRAGLRALGPDAVAVASLASSGTSVFTSAWPARTRRDNLLATITTLESQLAETGEAV